MDHVVLAAIAVGLATGLRSLTPAAMIAWASHLGWLNLSGSRLSFMSSTAATIIFTVLAVGELIADKLPTTPKRTALPPLLARIVLGGLCGACLFGATGEAQGVGAGIAAVGSVAGAYGGYVVRQRLVNGRGVKDFVVAIPEDLVTIALVGVAIFG